MTDKLQVAFDDLPINAGKTTTQRREYWEKSFAVFSMVPLLPYGGSSPLRNLHHPMTLLLPASPLQPFQ